MIDFKTKTLYFGYGDIAVGNTTIALRFRQFEPSMEVGADIIDGEMNFTSNGINIYLCSYAEVECLERLLDKMTGRDFFYFIFKEWTFNFANWNPKSIEVIKAHLNIVKNNMLAPMAC